MKRPKADFLPLFITKQRDASDIFVSNNKKRKKLSVFQLNGAMHGGKLIAIITVKTANRILSSLPELFSNMVYPNTLLAVVEAITSLGWRTRTNTQKTENTPCITLQISKLYICLRFQNAFKTFLGCFIARYEMFTIT